ncbi:chromosomal replication initiator protein DnaA [Trichloromonas acetexigens]|jgi:chromosomal replication initiator protein|uniref:Chromosomal replication initiator protein DnaA n=1 Tax=Trichloromonas acetexigens TaxID=38815 RepID=A0A550J5G4_9BACT|nr:chromosomal replication initiator protein DnaA [Desulfuromonas acetexigens]TRO78478.1 chromosomal replication initiator protein DnaA [Desulfuromonas acetexigens]
MPKNKYWQDCLSTLEKKISPQNFSTWIRPIRLKDITGNLVHLVVPNRFIRDWINENYQEIIEDTISQLINDKCRIKFEISATNTIPENEITEKDSIVKAIKKTDITSAETEKKNSGLYLNDKYTFEDFVPGSSNQFAYAAAMAVANNPATTYNPLFIYGGVGLGKTHIINAIGNEIINKNNNLKVCYYSSEKFMNELINCLRYAKMDEFRQKFRSMDVLLIDDVQFIAGKERTQEEFFHTFNALYESHKQIVVTSDKFPKDIPGLEERLRSRFEWGLIADIQPPDIETKQAILKMKADQNGIYLPEDVTLFLANSISSNVRELEGYLIRIGAYASLTSTPINLNMAKEILKNILIEKNKEISIEEIQKNVAAYFSIKVSDLKSAKRLKALVIPRQIAMYISRQLTSCSYPEIGDKFGGKDHSTIIHAIKKIERQLEEDYQLKITVENLKNSLTN